MPSLFDATSTDIHRMVFLLLAGMFGKEKQQTGHKNETRSKVLQPSSNPADPDQNQIYSILRCTNSHATRPLFKNRTKKYHRLEVLAT
jgi:hypothetical protein